MLAGPRNAGMQGHRGGRRTEKAGDERIPLTPAISPVARGRGRRPRAPASGSRLLASDGVISVIVPVRGEGPEAAERFAGLTSDPDAELLVADGGSDPATVEAFREIGARVISGAGTRGARLAEAARSARGDLLFFLHSDSRPPAGALDAIRGCLANGTGAGAFSLAYEGGGAGLRWIAAWANLRSRWFSLPFGDQGIFCRRDAYERAGGFHDLPICDDLDLVRRLRGVERLAILPQKTVTSPRRYRARGAFRQVLVNWGVQIGYFAGVSPRTLERWYNPK
jgi:rSAM/selenodomain-associated transferase 2